MVVIVTGGKQSQHSLPLDGFGLDLDMSWLEFDKIKKQLKASCMPIISSLACLILEIAMKKTLKLGFGRQPYNISPS